MILSVLICFSALLFTSASGEYSLPEKISFYDYAKESKPFSKDGLQELQAVLKKIVESRSTTANINDYVDTLLEEVRLYVADQGWDPTSAPDLQLSFEYKPLLITYKGTVNLTSGSLEGLSTIIRTGDVIVSYANKIVTVSIPLGFSSALFDYSYVSRIIGIRYTGGVKATVKNVAFTANIGFNFESVEVLLNSFSIDNLGSVSLKFSGNVLTDWLVNIFSKLFTSVFKNTLKNIVENNVYKVFVNLVALLNEGLQDIISSV